MVTKYAKWVDLSCGKCRFHSDIGTILEWDISPDCYDHETIECLICGEKTQRATKIHGSLFGGLHNVEVTE